MQATHSPPGLSTAPSAPVEMRPLRVAIVHYWLVGMRGGEKVLEALCEMYPGADIYTHVYVPERISERIRRHKVVTSFIARLPASRRFYQHYLALMPIALEQFDLSGYDLVISSESGPAKGVLTDPSTLHVCYCHTPMRYAWSGYHAYRSSVSASLRPIMAILMYWMRMWDLASAARVDHFVANSHNVAARIRKYYRREADVVHPPVDSGSTLPSLQREDYYLLVGQLVPYKGTELAIEAFNRLGKRLVVIGRGSEFRKLRRSAAANIEMLGWQEDAVVRHHLSRCRALIFPADEDFGIVPVEAMSAGAPVIALGRGGALETIVPGRTGLFFEKLNVDCLLEAIMRFEQASHLFDPLYIAAHAKNFSQQAFRTKLEQVVLKRLSEHAVQGLSMADPRPAVSAAAE